MSISNQINSDTTYKTTITNTQIPFEEDNLIYKPVLKIPLQHISPNSPNAYQSKVKNLREKCPKSKENIIEGYFSPLWFHANPQEHANSQQSDIDYNHELSGSVSLDIVNYVSNLLQQAYLSDKIEHPKRQIDKRHYSAIICPNNSGKTKKERSKFSHRTAYSFFNKLYQDMEDNDSGDPTKKIIQQSNEIMNRYISPKNGIITHEKREWNCKYAKPRFYSQSMKSCNSKEFPSWDLLDKNFPQQENKIDYNEDKDGYRLKARENVNTTTTSTKMKRYELKSFIDLPCIKEIPLLEKESQIHPDKENTSKRMKYTTSKDNSYKRSAKSHANRIKSDLYIKKEFEKSQNKSNLINKDDNTVQNEACICEYDPIASIVNENDQIISNLSWSLKPNNATNYEINTQNQHERKLAGNENESQSMNNKQDEILISTSKIANQDLASNSLICIFDDESSKHNLKNLISNNHEESTDNTHNVSLCNLHISNMHEKSMILSTTETETNYQVAHIILNNESESEEQNDSVDRLKFEINKTSSFCCYSQQLIQEHIADDHIDEANTNGFNIDIIEGSKNLIENMNKDKKNQYFCRLGKLNAKNYKINSEKYRFYRKFKDNFTFRGGKKRYYHNKMVNYRLNNHTVSVCIISLVPFDLNLQKNKQNINNNNHNHHQDDSLSMEIFPETQEIVGGLDSKMNEALISKIDIDAPNSPKFPKLNIALLSNDDNLNYKVNLNLQKTCQLFRIISPSKFSTLKKYKHEHTIQYDNIPKSSISKLSIIKDHQMNISTYPMIMNKDQSNEVYQQIIPTKKLNPAPLDANTSLDICHEIPELRKEMDIKPKNHQGDKLAKLEEEIQILMNYTENQENLELRIGEVHMVNIDSTQLRSLLFSLLNVLITQLLQKEEYQIALQWCKKGLKLDPYCLDLLHKQYKCKIKLGDIYGSEKLLKRIKILLETPYFLVMKHTNQYYFLYLISKEVGESEKLDKKSQQFGLLGNTKVKKCGEYEFIEWK